MVESWAGTVSNIGAIWRNVESWSGTVANVTQWYDVETWVETVTALVPAPWPTSPANYTQTNVDPPTFTWDNSQPADGFYLQIYIYPDNIERLSDPYIEGEKSYTPFGSLGDNYYAWRVRQERDGSSSSWSDNYYFRIDTRAPDVPTLVSPDNLINVNESTAALDWNSVEENCTPVVYEVNIATDLSFSNIILQDNLLDDNWYVGTTLDDNYYYWRVRAWDNIGNVKAWSQSPVREFRLDKVSPDSPELTFPMNNQWTTNPPNLDWLPIENENSNPVMYYVYIRYGTGGQRENSGWITDDNYVATTLYQDAWYWKVMVMDNAGNVSEYSPEQPFRVDTDAPDQVTATNPENMGAFDNVGVMLTWDAPDDPNPGSGVENYIIQVDDEESFTTPDNAVTTDTSYTYAFPSLGTYYWRVYAVDVVGNEGSTSDARIIRICTWSAVESWTGTINSTTPTWQVVESWSGTVTTTSGWQVVESWTGTVSNISAIWRNVESWSGTVSNISAIWRNVESWSGTVNPTPAYWRAVESWSGTVNPTPSYWQVVESWTGTVNPTPSYWQVVESWSGTVSSVGTGWSVVDGWTGTVDSTTPVWQAVESWTGTASVPVPAPTLVTPTNGYNTNSVTPTFHWENSQMADNFSLQVSSTSDFEALVIDETGLTENSYTPGSNLDDNTYYWWVSMYRSDENATWSENWTVTVDTLSPSQPTTSAPYDGENMIDTTPLFIWTLPEENSYPLGSYVEVWNYNRNAKITDTGGYIQTDNWEIPVENALADNRYYWRVMVKDNAGNPPGPWSAWQLFTVDTVPAPAPSLTFPENGYSTFDNTVSLDWAGLTTVEENTLPATYYVAISDDPAFPYENYNSGWIDDDNWDTEELYEGVYYWMVKAKDNAGNEGVEWSENRLFQVDGTPPAAPTIISPYNNENAGDNTPTITWDAVTDFSPPVLYQVTIDNDSDFSSPDNMSDWVSGTSYTSGSLLDDPYYVRVQAMDNAGNVGDNTEITFRIDTLQPDAPTIVSPKNNENVGDNTPTITWSALTENSSPVLYQVTIDNDNDFTSIDNLSDWVADTSYTSGYLWDNFYYVRVRAMDNAGNVGDNTEIMFYLDTVLPDAPTATWPVSANTNDNTPLLQWTAPAEDSLPIVYRVFLTNDPTFDTYYDSGWVDTENWEYGGELGESEWYWKVKARDNAGNEGGFTSDINFRIDMTSPNIPDLLLPANNENTNDNTTLLDWTETGDISAPVVYCVWIARDNEFTDNVIDSGWITDDFWSVASELDDNLYYWHVRSMDNGGNLSSDYSITREFRVDTLAPENVELVWPDNEQITGVGTQPNLDWTAADDNTNVLYKAVVSLYENFEENLADSGWITEDNWAVTTTLIDNDYYWTVLAADNSGNTFEASARWFRVETLPPPVPTLYWPVGEENTADNTPTIDWENVWDVSLPVTFYLLIATDSGFTDIVLENGWMYENYWTVPDDNSLTDNVYWWKVYSKDAAANENTDCLPENFRVDTLTPPAVTLYSPENHYSSESLTMAFEWSSLEDNSGVIYTIQIDDEPSFSNPLVHENTTLTENTYTYDINTGVYYWRIQSRDGANNTAEWSDYWEFAVGQWVAVETWTGAITTASTWQVVESWAGTVSNTSAIWSAVESWAGTVSNVDVYWGVVESWSGTVNPTPAYWQVVESWSGTVSNISAIWRNVESWSGTVSNISAIWRNVESWSGSVSNIDVYWGAVESWSGTVSNIDVYWRAVESWSGTVSNISAIWRNVESWSGTITPNAAYWQLVESWSGTVSNISAIWRNVESWSGSVSNIDVYWRAVESWSGTVSNISAIWRNVESWSGTVNPTPAYWQVVESWSGTVSNISAIWRNVESWSGTVSNISAIWRNVESWSGTVSNISAIWRNVESWSGTVSNISAIWRNVESWSGLVFATGPVPALSTPTDGNKTNDNTPLFNWDNTWVADNWEIWMDNDADFSSPEVLDNTDNNYYTPAELLDENYFWMVRGWLSIFTSPFSENWTFLVDTMSPDTPTKVTPGDSTITANLANTFSWSSVADNSYSLTGENANVQHYELIIDNDEDFGSPEHYDNTITTTSKLSVTLSPEIYQWIVRAWDYAGNVSDNESPWTITIDNTGPQAPTLTTPENGAMTNQTNNITFDWDDAADDYSGIDYYHILVDNDDDFLSPVQEEYPAGSTIQLTINTEENYYWKIQGYDRAGNQGDWSGVFTVLIDTTAPGVPVKSAPVNDNSTDNLTITFEWVATTDTSGSLTGESAGVRYYEVWVDNDNDFSSPENVENIESPDVDYVSDFTDENYFWQVRAWDNAGNAGDFETFWSFIVDTTAPEVPVLESPGDNSSTCDNTTTFTWLDAYDLAGVQNYEIWIDNDDDFSSPENVENVGSSPTYTLPEPGLGDENYYWKVKAYDIFGKVGEFSENWVVLIETGAPETPTGSATDGQVYAQVTPTILWNSVSDTTNSPTEEQSGVKYYEIQIDNDNDFNSIEYNQLSSDTQFDPVSDENYPVLGFPDENYSYQVRAWDNAGNAGDWSNTWTFIIDITPPSAPTLSSPENEKMLSGGTVTLQWTEPEDLSGISQYQVFVDNDDDFSSPTAYLVTTTNKEVTLTDERYYWRVRAKDGANTWGDNSEANNFLVDVVAPDNSTLGSPSDELMTNDNNENFTWSFVNDLSNSPTGEVAGVVAYEIWVDNDSDFGTPTLQENTTDNSRTIELADELYYWRVRVWDNVNNYSTSVNRTVLIDTRGPDNTSLNTPVNGTKTNDNTPTFDWSDIVDWSWSETGENAGVVQYEIWVDNDDGFGSSEILENRGTTSDKTPTSEMTDENYSWHVRVWDNAGNVSEYSGTWTIVIDTVTPTTPSKTGVSPDSGVDDSSENTITKYHDITFSWSSATDSSSSPTGESAGISYYEIIVDDDFVEPYTASENASGTGTTLWIPEGEWKWIVRAWDNSGNVGENETPWDIIVDNTPPAAPGRSSPDDGLITKVIEMTLDWTDGTDTYGIPIGDTSNPPYHLQVDNDPDFSSPLRDLPSLTISSQDILFYASDTGTSDENWSWRVAVTDNAGNTSDWSDNWTTLIDTVAPGEPENWSPANNEIVLTADVTVKWYTVSDYSNSPTGEIAGVRYYEVWVDNDNNFSSPDNVENIADPAFTYPTTLGDEDYSWRIRAWDYAGNASGFRDVWYFTIDNNPPPAPTLISLADGTMTNDNTPTLDWENVYDVTGVKFEIWIDNDDDFGSPEIIENVNENMYTSSSELGDENYSWKVRAWDGTDKAGEFSAQTWTILIDTGAPGVPSTSPQEGVMTNDNLLQVTWSPVSDTSNSPTGELAEVQYYEILLDNDPEFGSIEYQCLSSDNIFNSSDENYPSAGIPEENYSYEVRAWDYAGNSGDWSSAWTFVVDRTPPVAPDLLSPENNAADNNVVGSYVVVTHDWSDVEDASGIDNYIIEVDNDSNFSSKLSDGYFSSTPSSLKQSYVTVNYANDGRYYWHVKSADRAGMTGDWSETREFVIDRVAPPTPALYGPETGRYTSDNTPTFAWENITDSTAQATEISGLENYLLEIDSTQEFSAPMVFTTLRENWLTLPNENALSVGTWYWRVRAVDRAGNHGDWTENYSLTVEDLVISMTVSDNNVNPSQVFTISGRVSWEPDNFAVENTNVSVYIDENLVATVQTDSEGYYSENYSTDNLGTHTVLVAVTDNDGIYEDNTVTFKVDTFTITVSLDDATVNPGQQVTASGNLTRLPDEIADNAAITLFIDDASIATTYPIENGDYSCTFDAPDDLGSHTLRVYALNGDGIEQENTTSFTTKTVNITIELERYEANPNERLRIWGYAMLQPDDTPVMLTSMTIFRDNSPVGTAVTTMSGYFENEIVTPAQVGVYEYRVNLTASNLIEGDNTVNVTVKMVEISINYTDSVVNSGEVENVYGVAVLRPDNNYILNNNIVFYIIDPDTSLVVGGASGTTDGSGYYNLPFDSPSEIGTYEGRVSIGYGVFSQDNSSDLNVKTIDISLVFDDNVVNLNDAIQMSGTATLQPDGTPVGTSTVNIYRDNISYTTVQTDENGAFTYNYTEEATTAQRRSIRAAISNQDEITGENEQFFEKRIVDFTWFGTYDSHGQFDSVVNPGENFYPSVRIIEYNGSEYTPVTSAASRTLKISGVVYSITHVTDGYWRTLDAFTAPETLESQSISDIDVSVLTGNGIIGATYDNVVGYSVGAVNISISANDYVVNPGENEIYVSGTAILRPEDTPIDNGTVTVTFAGTSENTTTNENGEFSYLLTIPSAMGDYELKVEITDNRGLYQENTTTIGVKTIDLSLVQESVVAEEGAVFTFTGQALRQPENEPVATTDVNVYIDNSLVTTVQTLENGDYQFTHTFVIRGLYPVRVTLVDSDNITTENSLTQLAGRPITITGEMKSLEGTPIQTTMNFYNVGTSTAAFDITTDAQGQYSEEVFAGYFDLELVVENSGFTMKFENLNLNDLEAWSTVENLIRLDTPPTAFAAVTGTRSTLSAVAMTLDNMIADNYDNLTLKYNFTNSLGVIGDVYFLRVYGSGNWTYDTRSGGDWRNLEGTIDIVNYTITTSENAEYENVLTRAFVLAEYDPLSQALTYLENIGETAEALTQTAEQFSTVTTQLQSTVENLVTQENITGMATQENVSEMGQTLSDLLDSMSENIIELTTQENLQDLQGILQDSLDAIDENISVLLGLRENIATLENQSSEIVDNLLFGLRDNILSEINNLSVGIENLEENLAENLAGAIDFTALQNNFTALQNNLAELYNIVEENLENFVTGGVFSVIPDSISLMLYLGETSDVEITVTNNWGGPLTFEVSINNLSQPPYLTSVLSFTQSSTTIESGASGKITVRANANNNTNIGTYTGEVKIKASGTTIERTIPTTIRVLQSMRRVETKIIPLRSAISPGDNVPFEIQLKNTGTSLASTNVLIEILSPTGEVIYTFPQEIIDVGPGATENRSYVFSVPENAPEGDYLVRVSDVSSGESLAMTETKTLEVKRPTEEMKLLGIPLGLLIAIIVGAVSAGTTGYFVYRVHKKRASGKRRFEAKIFLNELPQAGPETIQFGTLAEAKQGAFLGLNDMKMHMMTAGATGGGKSISSMVIAEEALKLGKNVIVFDPTAQWTGFLRKCTDKRMMSHYPKFNLKESDARSFPGVVKLINDPRQRIDMKELLSEATRGKITVFVIERLKPGDADIFATNVIQSIFESRPMEYPELKNLIIFDEAHRLLPRFGGSGAGTIQIERAVREFRKWGMGVMLVSQVMGDFEEEIKTNIRTQVQFWTRESAELQRIGKTYGDEHVRSVSKAPIGFGMVVNPDYNRGRPYYVNFRPILHSVTRLSPDELDKYYAADDRVENIKYKLKKLEEKGVDVFDVRIELGLAQRKLEEASFDMVAAYLDSLEPRVEDICARHGLKGIKRVVEMMPESEIKKIQMAAIKEREGKMARTQRTPEIVEAYKEILGTKKEVTHGEEVTKPLKAGEEDVHPGAKEQGEGAETGEEELHPDAMKEKEEAKVEIKKGEKPKKIDMSEKKKPEKKATNGKSKNGNGKKAANGNGKKASNGDGKKNGKGKK
jgi:hypothetical protein